MRWGLLIAWASCHAFGGVAWAEPAGPARFLEGPFEKVRLDRRLEQCPNNSRAVGHRQRRATASHLVPPFRDAYVTEVYCADETDQYLVISLGTGESFVERVAVIRKITKGDPLRRNDPFESLLQRGEPARPQIWLTINEAGCRRGLWIGVGPSRKPSVIESRQDCTAASARQRAIVAAPTGLQFP